MKKLLFIFSFFFLFVLNGKTQEVEILTLEDCLRIGIDNNLSLEGKRKEIQRSKYGVSENRSKLLPQINAIAGYSNNFDPPVSVTDGSSYGVPYNITQTLQHSANAGLEMQMPLFNQTLYTSMSIAKVMEEISRLSYGKAREDVILQISKMYYLGQVTAEQIMLIKANITRLEELRDITQAFFDNGMSMEVDLKRVNINLENLKVQYDNAQAMMKQQLNMLKYIMDYPAEKEIALTPVNTDSITTVALTGLSENIYELQLSQSQVQLAERQKKIITNGYIPSLSLTGSWRYAAYTDKGYHWFHSGPSNQWFRSYGVGLTLRIPIFDGLDKTYKIKKAMHQEVHKGDTLLVLDDREYKIRVMEAEAALKDAQAGATVINATLNTTQTTASVYDASIAEIEVRLAKLEKDRKRYENLVKRNAATPIQLEQIVTDYEATRKKLEATKRQKKAALSGVDEVSYRRMNTEAAIQRATAALEMARLNLSYTVVIAPCDGKLGRRSLEEGQFISAGQTITYILPDTQKWIVANYKETQIENLHIGQEVFVTVDAISDKEFKGKVTSISGATGSKYSLVPTDNSAGNFVKIQQRIPVRIDFTDLSKEDNERLAAGMMVVVKARL